MNGSYVDMKVPILKITIKLLLFKINKKYIKSITDKKIKITFYKEISYYKTLGQIIRSDFLTITPEVPFPLRNLLQKHYALIYQKTLLKRT